MRRPIALITAISASAAAADVVVTFQDGAPKDRFSITQMAPCPIGPASLVIDLGTAPAGLIFDTTATGAGVDVFQPFEWVAIPTGTTAAPQVRDGDTVLVLDLPGLSPQVPLVFTIDLDDTTSTRQITVSGAEVAGATVTLGIGEIFETGVFETSGSARVVTSACTS